MLLYDRICRSVFSVTMLDFYVDSLQIAHLIAAGGIYLYRVAASGEGEKLVFMECAATASSWLMLGVCSNRFLRRQQISQETE